MAAKKKAPTKKGLRTRIIGTKGRKVVHVTYRDKGSLWHVTGESGRSLVSHLRKSDAINDARERAQAGALGQVVIHGKDGKIEREYTYGADPRKSKG
jgi:hypothetical protein